MLHTHMRAAAAGVVLTIALLPGMAFAASDSTTSPNSPSSEVSTSIQFDDYPNQEKSDGSAFTKTGDSSKSEKSASTSKKSLKKHILQYDRKLIEQIGTQEQTGHTICCPSFSCAYADAIIDGTVHDHEYYSCSCCTWTDWGGGGSWDRCVGTDEELLREAYDQITAGKPTVIHVAANYGEHWIVLFGYKNADDPDHLTLANFVALDPWDGAEIDPSDRFDLYGDGCEHISDR